MADAVATQTLLTGRNRMIRKFTNISDGTGEADVVKWDASALTGPNGVAPTSITIEEIFWNIQGITSVRVEFDATTDDLAFALSGSGYLDLTAVGGVKDPLSSGTTGDILFTTNGAVSGGTYNILMVVRLEG